MHDHRNLKDILDQAAFERPLIPDADAGPHLNELELRERAIRLYRKSPVHRHHEEPHHRNVEIREIDGRTYAIVRRGGWYGGDGRPALAVFRVRPDGQLKRLRRFPLEITT